MTEMTETPSRNEIPGHARTQLVSAVLTEIDEKADTNRRARATVTLTGPRRARPLFLSTFLAISVNAPTAPQSVP